MAMVRCHVLNIRISLKQQDKPMTEKDMGSRSEDKMPDDDEIIELIEEVPNYDSDGEDLIELTEAVTNEDEDGIIELTELAPDEDNDDVIDLTEVASSSAKKLFDDNTDTLPLAAAVTPEQLDAALERTVEKLYGQKIESLLVEIVQKKVSGEIEKIRKMILEDVSDN
jgi:hypothetical protein